MTSLSTTGHGAKIWRNGNNILEPYHNTSALLYVMFFWKRLLYKRKIILLTLLGVNFLVLRSPESEFFLNDRKLTHSLIYLSYV